MGQLDEALHRLDRAVATLESAVERGTVAAQDGNMAEIVAERDRLADEVERLLARAAEDARLRSEAAAAVREVLHDLRGAVGQPVDGLRGNA